MAGSLALAFGVLVVAGPAPAQSSVERYVVAAIDSIEANALRSAQVDWPAVRGRALARVRGARQPVESYAALREVLAALDDHHSFLQLSDSLRAIEAQVTGRREADDGPAPRSRGPSPFGRRMRPEFRVVTDDGPPIAVVAMPQGRRSAAFAVAFQDSLRALAARRPCGWVVDLRGNGGGDMWPMLAGLGPLIGEGVVGGSVGAGGEHDEWIYRDGRSIYRSTTLDTALITVPAPFRPDGTPPIAVLIDRGTASSGEAMAVAFIGRPATALFGERSYGASTATRGIRLPDGANIVLAISTFVDRNGRAYPDGVTPDVPTSPGGDDALEPALRWLRLQRACSP